MYQESIRPQSCRCPQHLSLCPEREQSRRCACIVERFFFVLKRLVIINTGRRTRRVIMLRTFQLATKPFACRNTSRSKRFCLATFAEPKSSLRHDSFCHCSHLAAVKNGKIVREAFTFPSCCVCVVKQPLLERANTVRYRSYSHGVTAMFLFFYYFFLNGQYAIYH